MTLGPPTGRRWRLPAASNAPTRGRPGCRPARTSRSVSPGSRADCRRARSNCPAARHRVARRRKSVVGRELDVCLAERRVVDEDVPIVHRHPVARQTDHALDVVDPRLDWRIEDGDVATLRPTKEVVDRALLRDVGNTCSSGVPSTCRYASRLTTSTWPLLKFGCMLMPSTRKFSTAVRPAKISTPATTTACSSSPPTCRAASRVRAREATQPRAHRRPSLAAAPPACRRRRPAGCVCLPRLYLRQPQVTQSLQCRYRAAESVAFDQFVNVALTVDIQEQTDRRARQRDFELVG